LLKSVALEYLVQLPTSNPALARLEHLGNGEHRLELTLCALNGELFLHCSKLEAVDRDGGDENTQTYGRKRNAPRLGGTQVREEQRRPPLANGLHRDGNEQAAG